MKIRKLAASVAIGASVAAGAAACGTAAYAATPASYGQYYGGAWHCYYVHDAYEATQLIHAGHCHYGDIPTLMPLWWHEEYYSYYSTSGYVNHFVLPSYRSSYRSVQITTFSRTYRSQITSLSSKASYKGRNGKTVTAPKPKFTTGTKGRSFGGGSSRSRTSTGSGSSRTGQGSRSRTSTGGGSRSSGRSFGGGTSRRR
jgi:hypothetical protein